LGEFLLLYLLKLKIFHKSVLGTIVKLRDFPGAQNVPTEEADPHTEFSPSLSWLYCATLAISLYCMGIIGILHKGLDYDNYLRISKVNFREKVI
jgi:hypothetical protein